MKQKYCIILALLLITIIFASSCTQQPQQVKQKDDFGCFPSSCSSIPDPYGKQQCEEWKAGKKVTWPPDCKLTQTSECIKLCEAEKQGTASGGGQKQSFNVLPSLIKAEFANGVSEEDKNFVIQGISTMDFYLQKWFGKSTNKPSGLRVGANVPADEGSGAQVKEENGTIIILMETGSAVWSRQIQSNKESGGEWRPRLAAHEYVHVYQFQNGCGKVDAEIPITPKWFAEGEAEWLSYKAAKEAGQLPSWFSITQYVIPVAKQQTRLLKSFEKPDELNFRAYFLYTMAVDYLMKDKPIKALDDFCANLAGGKEMSMPKAFDAAFGISLDKFYEEFESYRKTWSSESSSGQGQIPQEYQEFCAQFASIPSCSSVGQPGSQNYNGCKQCYPNK